MSLPVRERGLKFYKRKKRFLCIFVAPCAGAWVEIMTTFLTGKQLRVAPCAGAWVEIPGGRHHRRKPLVAPCAGAWVEISSSWFTWDRLDRSLPVRERGLKYVGGLLQIHLGWSLPVRERGLKFLAMPGFSGYCGVAPCAGAWVEIPQTAGESGQKRCRSLCGSVG